MNQVMRWSGLLCGLLTAMGCGGMESATPPQTQERAVRAEALTTQTAASSWTTTPAMPAARQQYQAALLNSGLVLVMGGNDINWYPSSKAMLYNPYSNTWQSTGDLYFQTSHYASVRLASGKVLVSGGYDYLYMVSGAQVYDPDTGAWSSGGSLSLRRQDHRATLLQSGKVLVTGGTIELPRNGPDPRYADPTFAELYDPEKNSWSLAGDVGHGTNGSVPVLLYSGEVMLITGNQVDFYDPATNTWRQGPSKPGPGGGIATRLYSGEVLVVSGTTTSLYDPYNAQWRSGPPSQASHSGDSTVTLLYSGQVLIAGAGSTELYDPSAATWTLKPNIPVGYTRGTSLLLQTGQVLVTGGQELNSVASIFTP